MNTYGVAIKPVQEAPLKEIDFIRISIEAGVEGDWKKRSPVSHRQITVISLEQWNEACGELGISLSWSDRRSQICITGYSFSYKDVGKKIKFGGGVILEITGETTPCDRMDKVSEGLKAALTPEWRGGVTCRVIKGGTVFKGEDCYIE